MRDSDRSESNYSAEECGRRILVSNNLSSFVSNEVNVNTGVSIYADIF